MATESVGLNEDTPTLRPLLDVDSVSDREDRTSRGTTSTHAPEDAQHSLCTGHQTIHNEDRWNCKIKKKQGDQQNDYDNKKGPPRRERQPLSTAHTHTHTLQGVCRQSRRNIRLLTHTHRNLSLSLSLSGPPFMFGSKTPRLVRPPPPLTPSFLTGRGPRVRLHLSLSLSFVRPRAHK